MTSIQKVTKLRNLGVLRDFTWDSELYQFGRYNLIYGWNGSGKTTLSRLFRYLEHRSVPTAGQVQLCIDGRETGGHDFPNTTVQVRVFNRDFVNESVFPTGGGDVPPIFVLGTGSVEKQKVVNLLMTEKVDLKDEFDRAQQTLTKSKRELDSHAVTCARNIKDTLRVPGSGTYNEFDKRAYRNLADKMLAANDIESHRLTEVARNHLLMQHTATIKPQLSEVMYTLTDVRPIYEAAAIMRASTVVSSVLEDLENNPQLSGWTREGLILHKERQLETCLYCQQPIPTHRRAALEAHFSSEYERFLNQIDNLLERVSTIETGFTTAVSPDKAAFYENITEDYVAAQSAFDMARNDLKSFFHSLKQLIKEKSELPFKSLSTDLSIPNIDIDVVNRLNEVIHRHNSISRDFQSRTSDARDRLASDMIADYTGEYADLKSAATIAAEAIEPIQTEIQNGRNRGPQRREVGRDRTLGKGDRRTSSTCRGTE